MTNFDSAAFERNMQGVFTRVDLSRSVAAFTKSICQNIADPRLAEVTAHSWNQYSNISDPSVHLFDCTTPRRIDLEEWFLDLSESDAAQRFAGYVLSPNVVELQFNSEAVRCSLMHESDDDSVLSMNFTFVHPWDTRRVAWEGIIRADTGLEVEDDGPLVILPASPKMTADSNDVLGIITGSIQTVLQGATFAPRF